MTKETSNKHYRPRSSKRNCFNGLQAVPTRFSGKPLLMDGHKAPSGYKTLITMEDEMEHCEKCGKTLPAIYVTLFGYKCTKCADGKKAKR